MFSKNSTWRSILGSVVLSESIAQEKDPRFHMKGFCNSCDKAWHLMRMISFYYDDSNITKTYLYNFDPLKPQFYIVKLGFTGVYIIFHITT